MEMFFRLFFFNLISPPPLSKSIYFSICNISLGDPGRCGAFAAWWKVSKRGNNAPLRSNPERGRGGHWTTDATFLKIASKTLLKKAFLERNSNNIPSVVSKHFSFANLLSSRKWALERRFAGKATSVCIKGSTFLIHPTFRILFACMQTFLVVWKISIWMVGVRRKLINLIVTHKGNQANWITFTKILFLGFPRIQNLI